MDPCYELTFTWKRGDLSFEKKARIPVNLLGAARSMAINDFSSKHFQPQPNFPLLEYSSLKEKKISPLITEVKEPVTLEASSQISPLESFKEVFKEESALEKISAKTYENVVKQAYDESKATKLQKLVYDVFDAIETDDFKKLHFSLNKLSKLSPKNEKIVLEEALKIAKSFSNTPLTWYLKGCELGLCPEQNTFFVEEKIINNENVFSLEGNTSLKDKKNLNKETWLTIALKTLSAAVLIFSGYFIYSRFFNRY